MESNYLMGMWCSSEVMKKSQTLKSLKLGGGCSTPLNSLNCTLSND